MTYNEFQQPIGESLPDYKEGQFPKIQRLEGKYCILEHLSAEKHLSDLYYFYGKPYAELKDWTYLSSSPVANKEELLALLMKQEASTDPYYFVIIDKKGGKTIGTFALMRIDPKNRVIEVGTVIFSKALQRTRMATEAQYLLAKYVFETLRYRRYEWKCDALNAPSRYAAQRLGFIYEGTFRQAIVYKGRTRDTAWFSMIDKEWKGNRQAFEQWLSEDNFTIDGFQKHSLSELKRNLS